MPQDEDEQDVNLQNDAEDGDDTAEDKDDTDASADDDKGGDNDEGSDESGDQGNVDDVTDPDELKEKLKKSNDANKKLFARLQDSKSLKLDKATGKWVPKEKKNSQDQGKKKPAPKKDELTTRDLYALMDAKVPKQDIEEVQDYAKLKGITIEEALETSFVKARLETLAEERQTADAANTGPSRGGSTKPSKSEIRKNAQEKGELPDDQGAIEDLVESRLQERIGNK